MLFFCIIRFIICRKSCFFSLFIYVFLFFFCGTPVHPYPRVKRAEQVVKRRITKQTSTKMSLPQECNQVMPVWLTSSDPTDPPPPPHPSNHQKWGCCPSCGFLKIYVWMSDLSKALTRKNLVRVLCGMSQFDSIHARSFPHVRMR